MLYPISWDEKGNKLSVATRPELLVEVTNISRQVQKIGSIQLRPEQSIKLPYEIAKAFIGRPEFRVSWNVGSDIHILHVIRYPGLGDRIFAVAACYAFHQAYPRTKIYFETFLNDKIWIHWVPFVEFGKPSIAPDKTVNLDNAPAEGGDRCQIYGRLLGVEVKDIRFPIRVPRLSVVPDKSYLLFAPCNSGRSMTRSLAPAVVKFVLEQDYGLDIVLIDKLPIYFEGHRTINLTAKTKLHEVWSLAKHAEAIITVDTGVAWVGACLGKPTLVFFAHVGAHERVLTCKTVWVVEPEVTECHPCGDRHLPMPCGASAKDVPACMTAYTPEVVHYKILEFLHEVL